MISERIKSGVANATTRGKVIGRPITAVENLPSNFIKYYPKYKKKQINKRELARLCDVSPQSVYK